MRKLIPVTLDKKLVFLVMAVSLIGIGVTFFISFHYTTLILGERATNQLIGEAAIRGSTVESTMNSKIQEIQVITTNPMMRILVSELNQIEDTRILAEAIAQKRMDFLIEVQAYEVSIGGLDDLENVEIIGIDGERLFVLINTKNKNDYMSDPIFVRGLKEPFTQIILDADGKRKIVTAAPIFEKPEDQSPIGVAIITASTKQIDSILLNRKGLGQTGESYLVSMYGYMMSESRFIPNAPFVQKVDTEPLKYCLADGQIYYGIHDDYRGISVLGASNCMKSLGMSMIVEIDEAEVFEPVKELRDKIIVLGVIITVIVGVAAYFLSKRLSKPLIRLKNAATQVANGDFNVRTNIKTDDEIGQLSRSFDQMAEQIQDSLLKIKEREEVIKQQKDILLQFSQYSSNYCVCFVDIVGSTKLTSKLSDIETSKFYSIFLNSAAGTITQNYGIVVKNIGDALLYYFPKTESEDQAPFEEMLHCCMKLIEARTTINLLLGAENLPEVSYRISAMYGPVRVAIVATSTIDDIFGSTVNSCSKINSLAKPNTLVIGESLYQKVKDIKEYKFEKISEYAIDAENKFAVYLVSQ